VNRDSYGALICCSGPLLTQSSAGLKSHSSAKSGGWKGEPERSDRPRGARCWGGQDPAETTECEQSMRTVDDGNKLRSGPANPRKDGPMQRAPALWQLAWRAQLTLRPARDSTILATCEQKRSVPRDMHCASRCARFPKPKPAASYHRLLRQGFPIRSSPGRAA